MRKLAGCILWIVLLGVLHVADAQTLPTAWQAVPSGGALNRTAYSPQGSWVAVGGRDAHPYIYDATTGELTRQLDVMPDWVMSLAFSPDETRLATGDRAGTVYIWDWQRGAIEAIYTLCELEISGLAFSADGETLAVACRDGTVTLLHLPTTTTIATLENFGGPVWDIRFSPDGRILASASEDGTIWLWGLWDGTLGKLMGHEAPVTSLAYAAEGERLISGSLDGTVRVWDLATNGHEGNESAQLRGHLAPILGVALIGETAFSASLDGTLRAWDVSNRKPRELAQLVATTSPLIGLAQHPAGLSMALSSTDGTLTAWPTDAGSLLALRPRPAEVVVAPPTAPADPQEVLVAPPGLQEVVAPPTAPAAPPEVVAPVLAGGGRRMSIPAIGLESALTTFPLGAETWEINPYEALVGHFQGTPWMDTVGNLVMGGHSEYPDGRAGIFRGLYGVGLGDEIFLADGDLVRRYVVVNILSVDYRDLSVLASTPFNRITLITCDIPSYVQEQGIYYARLVVVADEVR